MNRTAATVSFALAALSASPSIGQDLPVTSVSVFKDGHALVRRAGTVPTRPDGSVFIESLPEPVLGTFWAESLLGAAEVRFVRTVAPRFVQPDARPRGTPQVTQVSPGGLEVGLAWAGAPAGAADVSVSYVQRGLRWLPSYKIDLGKNGKASVTLDASIVNEIADLNRVTAEFVVGLPIFEHTETVDPIGGGSASPTQLGDHFPDLTVQQQGANREFARARVGAFSGSRRSPAAAQGAALPTIEGGSDLEDLYYYTAENVTLERGERLQLRLRSDLLEYEESFRVDIPVLPVARERGSALQQFESLDRLVRQPVPRRVLTIENESDAPITTAPALVLSDGRVLAQSSTSYTPIGEESQIDVTAAVDIVTDSSEEVVGREPNALRHNRIDFTLVRQRGNVVVKNTRNEEIKLTLTRLVFGEVEEAGGGETKRLSSLNAGAVGRSPIFHEWRLAWRYWWPWWGWRLNGLTELSWDLTLGPGEEREVNFSWSYYWR